MRILVTFFLFVVLSINANPSFQDGSMSSAELRVNVDSISNTDGKMVIALFTNKETWLKDGKAYISERIKFDSTYLTYTFNKLPIGKYGIAVYHDKNTNGTFDRSFLGLPKEPYGFSNNPKRILSKPSFRKVEIGLKKDTSIIIYLK